MSFVTDHIYKIDRQLNSLQLPPPFDTPFSPRPLSSPEGGQNSPPSFDQGLGRIDVQRIERLQASIKALSKVSSGRIILDGPGVIAILKKARLLDDLSDSESIRNGNDNLSLQQEDLEWLLISKATTQIYGLVLKLLLDQTTPLSNQIEYWDEVLGSYRYTALYAAQTSPLTIWKWVQSIWYDACHKLQSMEDTDDEYANSRSSLKDRWGQFYGLVKNSIQKRTLIDVRFKSLSPLIFSQLEAETKRRQLKRLRDLSASGLGILVDEGMVLDDGGEDPLASKAPSALKEEWKSVVSKSVSLMEAVLHNITALRLGLADFEETVFMSVDEESGGHHDEEGVLSQPVQIAQRLQHLLEVAIPAHVKSSNQAASEYGRPSWVVRYWLPAVLVLSSGSTIFRIIANRKTEILRWLEDLGTTIIDFWANWVVEPVKKVINTIRHDQESEIAIMSKDSLKDDKASLERMVVQFAMDNPNTSDGSKYTEAQMVEVRTKVAQGDFTPVLRAFEKDLKRPFVGTVRGELIRALLIQIQKTKVDVEFALGGIDNLLKSQELVFGFIGVTPGALLCIGIYRWVSGFFAERRGRVQGQKQGSMIDNLWNVDRILTASTPHDNILTYRDHGLLLCEVHVLRQRAAKTLTGSVNNKFLKDIQDLTDLRTGVERQLRVVERIRWAFTK